jgi:hypothetical protein
MEIGEYKLQRASKTNLYEALFLFRLIQNNAFLCVADFTLWRQTNFKRMNGQLSLN